MTLFIGDQVIQSADGFSDRGRSVLAFIDGGREWTNWAMTVRTAPYAFADESAFLATVQQGLHGVRLVLMSTLGLLVSPVKLMSLSGSELFALHEVEKGKGGTKEAARAQRVLEHHDLKTSKDLESIGPFLTNLGVADRPVFQALGFSDRLALLDMMAWIDADADDTSLTLTDLDHEAAAFAADEARTPLEFIDYVHVYKNLANKPNAKTDPGDRLKNAQAAVHALLPLLFWGLDCPQVPGLVAPSEVASAVKMWVATGKAVGFARLSAGVREVVAHTHYHGQTGQAVREYLRGYLKASRELLEGAEISRGLLGQDGATCVFPIASHQCEAWLKLDADGVISLTSFRLKRRRKTSDDDFKFSDDSELEKAS
jgi:hypothetical protein